MRCGVDRATHGVIGHYNGAVGVLYWHDNEFAAYVEARRIRLEGGEARVERYESVDYEEIHGMIFGEE